MEGTVREIKSLEAEIKRMNARKKKLLEQKRKAQQIIFNYMQKHNLEEYAGIKLKKVAPKPKKKRVGIKTKRELAVQMLFDAGVPDPRGFWDTYQQSVKPKPVE